MLKVPATCRNTVSCQAVMACLHPSCLPRATTMSSRILNDLPAELSIYTIESAGRRATTGWVAASLLVSSRFHAILLPILYHTVRVTKANHAALVRIADSGRRGNFALTERVLIDELPDYAANPLVGLFGSSVTCVNANIAFCRALAVAPRVLVVPGMYNLHDLFEHLAQEPRAFRGTHLYVACCLLSPLDYPPLGQELKPSRLTHIVLEPWVAPGTEDRIQTFVRNLRALLAVPTLQRLLVRTGKRSLGHVRNAPSLRKELATLGDQRVRIDDGFTDGDFVLSQDDVIWTSGRPASSGWAFAHNPCYCSLIQTNSYALTSRTAPLPRLLLSLRRCLNISTRMNGSFCLTIERWPCES